MVKWRLKAGSDRRFRSGHPWVYSNEILESPKGIEPGESIELGDASGKFLARGYGNPSSLISFRALTRKEEDGDPFTPEFLEKKLLAARGLRERQGFGDVSHRLIYGEADGLPGLIVDRYRMAPRSPAGQVFVIQAHTAGADRMIPALIELLPKHSTVKCAIVVRNDVGVRKLEGLEEQEPRVVLEVPGQDLEHSAIRVASASGGDPLEFHVDLLKGQKTGFFLDQYANIQLAASRLGSLAQGKGTIRILDLCSYVGQWSAQLAQMYRARGLQVEVTLVDASGPALTRARKNVEAQDAKCESIKGDVLKDLGGLAPASFDLVICDPPALIKGRKDIPAGTHAYLQLNTQAFRLVAKPGAIVTCSCSALLEEDSFLKTLSKAAYRNEVQARWIARGAQSGDHPMMIEFPEGRYLKCWIGLV